MIHVVFGFFNNKEQQKQKVITAEDNSSYNSYTDEYRRLEQQRQDSESIWEERTYQLSAGGLSLTFAVFSFLINKDGFNKSFEWPMAVIWSIYTLCLVFNYISHRVSISNFSKYIAMLEGDRNGNKVYDERVLAERYNTGDKLINFLNSSTEISLITNIIFTVVYSFYIFVNFKS